MSIPGANTAAFRPIKTARTVLVVLAGIIASNYRHIERNMIAISICGLVGMPLYYFVWHDLFPQPYENVALRLIGAGLCLPFVFKEFWPESLRKYLPILWYATVLYILPFFFTFMLLQNDFSAVWLVSFVAALLLLVFLVNWLNLIFLTVAGMFLAWSVFTLGDGTVSDPTIYLELMPVVLFVMVVGTVFSYRSETLKQQRLDAMLMAGRNLSLEMREPLLGIRTSTISLSQYLPLLLQTYEMAEENGLPVREIPPAHREVLRHSMQRLQDETAHANTVIEMLLRNSGGVPIDPKGFDVFSIAECIKMALARYPFRSEKERKLVKVRLNSDFGFFGSDSAMVHVILSLLKTSLASLAVSGKGDVTIDLDASDDGNQLRLRNTSGVSAAGKSSRLLEELSLPDSTSGAAPALGYVKSAVESFSGSVFVHSTRGSHTDYVIALPLPPEMPQSVAMR